MDERLRQLERRRKETGTVAAEAAYLLERVRAGELTRERLELAAYCGHGPAVEALGAAAGPGDLLELVTGLARFGPPVLMRAGLSMAYAALPFMGEDRRVAVAALEEKERWVLVPCETLAGLVRSPLQLRLGVFPAGWVVYMACQAPVALRQEGWRVRPIEDPLAAAVQVVFTARLHLGKDVARAAVCERLVADALA